jgi:hypothetical protein
MKTYTTYASFLLQLCLLSSIVCFVGCEKDIDETIEEVSKRIVFDAESENPLIQFIDEEKNAINQSFQTHIRKTATYAKIPYARLPVKDFNKKKVKIASATRVLVITNPKSLGKAAFRDVVAFVANGGTVFLPIITDDPKYAFLAGLAPNSEYTISKTAKGFHFITNFLPGMRGVYYDNKSVHSALLDENFLETVTILATASNEDTVPTITQNNIGSGTVISINSSQEGRKQDRGLYFAAMLSALEHVPYPIVNATSIFIDDFPSPTYTLMREPIASEYKLDETSFYRDIWWPDMKNLAKEANIKYTAMVCFDYRNLDSPPFLFSEWEQATFSAKGSNLVSGDVAMENVLDLGGELGLHGYNHLSLMEEQWENPAFMEIALQAAQKKWKIGNYGPLPVTYVPPSNDIDSVGLAAISSALTSLQYNSSLYLGEFENGGEREFDVEPLNDHFFDFPRITSGYTMNSETQFHLQSLYLYTGIWTHFIHPDDVYQIPYPTNLSSRGDYEYRNNESLNWKKDKEGEKGLFPRFKGYLKEFRKQYPMLRSMQAHQAASRTKDWRNTVYEHSKTAIDYVVSAPNISNSKKAYFWFVYSSLPSATKLEAVLKRNGHNFTKTAVLDGYLYQVKTDEARIAVPRLVEKTKPNTEPTAELNTLLTTYEKYELREPVFATIDAAVAYFANQGNTTKAIELLQEKLITSNTPKQSDYELLYQYYSWKGEEERFYAFLETQYQLSLDRGLVSISKIVSDKNDYPNNSLRKLWMERQLKLYPNDASLHKNYLAYFGSESEVQFQDLKATEVAFKKASTATERLALLPKLIAENSVILEQFLNQVTPCGDARYNELAHEIAQWLADSGMYSQAIAWARCTEKISEETVSEWRVENGAYAFLKNVDFQKYIEQLIAQEPKLLTKELINVTPCSYKFNTDVLATIAYAFADQGSYRSAYQWSSCIEDFDVKEQLQWLANMRAINEMELRYEGYIKNNPKALDVKLQMATLYSELGEIRKAWEIASVLPFTPEWERLRAQLNKDVLYILPEEQKTLLANHSSFFYPEVFQQLTKQLRINYNDFLVSSSNMLADLLQPTTLTNQIGYGKYSEKGNQHIFGLSQNTPYALQLEAQEIGNTTLSLNGVFYSFKSKEREKKPSFTARGGLEYSDTKKLYYQAEAGVAISIDSLYSSAQLSLKPAITAPAYNLDIYRAQLNIYEEFRFNPKWQLAGGFEGNYYTDNVFDGLVSTNLKNNYFLNKSNTLSPYLEGAGMLGTIDYSQGYPYWTIEERLYGGIGLGYVFADPKKEIKIGLDVSTFFDTFSGTFQRYRGMASLPLFEYFYINFNAEFYTLENFYSNNFTLGLKYHFKN